MPKEEKVMNLNPVSIARKISSKIGVKGVLLGTAATTAVLEFGSGALEKYLPNTGNWKSISDQQIVGNAPLLGRVDVRDAVVLSPSIGQALRVVKKGKPNFKVIAVNYGLKVIFRNLGLNPLPDKHKPEQAVTKKFSYQLPARM